MKDWGTKEDNVSSSAGSVTAEDFNSAFGELENSVTPFLSLDGEDNKQLSKAIDIFSKAIFYNDTGSANNVELSRSQTTVDLETLKDGACFLFTPAYENTGDTTLQLKSLTSKDLYYDGAHIPSGFLNPNWIYMAVYDSSDDRFDCYVLGSSFTPKDIKDLKTPVERGDSASGSKDVSNEVWEEVSTDVTVPEDGLYLITYAISCRRSNSASYWDHWDVELLKNSSQFNHCRGSGNTTAISDFAATAGRTIIGDLDADDVLKVRVKVDVTSGHSTSNMNYQASLYILKLDH